MISQEALVGIEIQVRDATNAYLINFKSYRFIPSFENNTIGKTIPTLFIQVSVSGGILIIILVLLNQTGGNYNEIIPLIALYTFAGMKFCQLHKVFLEI